MSWISKHMLFGPVRQDENDQDLEELKEAIQVRLDSGVDEFDQQGLRALAEEIKAQGREKK